MLNKEKLLKSLDLSGVYDSLLAEGLKIIREEARRNNTIPRSLNMMDAYGTAVYVKGKMVRVGYVNDTPRSREIHKGWSKYGISDDTGRGYLDDFFKDYNADPFGIELVCVNAVYYAQILEEGAQGRPSVSVSRKYRIISGCESRLNKLKGEIEGSFVKTIKS